MKKLRCVVVDDESIARKALQGYIDKIDELSHIRSFRNGLEAKKWLIENEVDLLFMDINMPHLNGLELLRILKDHPPTIFTTAYPEHALASFEFNVIDYLVKPISFERFLQSINKALRVYNVKNQEEKKYLILKEGNDIIKIFLTDIIYIEAMQNYIKIQTPKTRHTILMSLKEIASQLPDNLFFQTHRSFIIQLNRITKIQGSTAFSNDHTIPVSKRNRNAFLEKFRSL